ncbi:peptidoglycan DD-metalloendopeptidase family protein [Micrococcus luteus]|uniref:peptidoglycan DD-metalloendopeptidase family protein n=1 Tax=Micrococcus luteus TaxID=1270 RepID=UPI0019D2EAD9|nr:peptidoglycan DD-metalloendopeptidase family protein [Micrococcus luteus]MBN6759698.1 peptidoglycan DD-metalloendopeptidase family protein [Micrococcus luteus]MBN6801229.1 peptidoglycan DD-metalloendopeptidase family protein [Micrococcus luteus]
MSTGEEEEHHEPAGAAGARVRRAVIMVAVSIVLCIGLLIMLVLGLVMFTGAGMEKKRQQDLAASTCLAPEVATGVAGDGSVAVPVAGTVTSLFGRRDNPFGEGGGGGSAGLTSHTGLDIGAPEGTPIYAAMDGTVDVVSLGGQQDGNGVLIDSGGGVKILYWHAANNTIRVKQGDVVKAGQHIAGVGDTGVATGYHLHMEVRVNGEKIDPAAFFRERGLIFELRKPPRLVETARKTGASASSSATSASAEPSQGRDDPTQLQTEQVKVMLPEGIEYELKPEQIRNAAAIIGAGQAAEVSDQAIIVALMTALQESMLYNLASPAVPESLAYPHDRQAVNMASVGLFQQQHTMGWGPVADLMQPSISARTFFLGHENPGAAPALGLLDYPGWESMHPGVAAQVVQKSRHPDGYIKWEQTATQILSQVTGTAPVPSGCSGQAVPAGEQPGPANGARARDEDTLDLQIPAGLTREDIVAAAESGVGGAFTYGAADFQSWDSSGFVYWVYRDQGIEMPRTSPWAAGERTQTPQPGDLVAQQWNAQRQRWDHVGIYVGDGMMISAINEDAGTRKHPVTQTGESPTYFTIIKEQQ